MDINQIINSYAVSTHENLHDLHGELLCDNWKHIKHINLFSGGFNVTLIVCSSLIENSLTLLTDSLHISQKAYQHMSLVVRKPVFGVSDPPPPPPHKPGCRHTEEG